MNFLHGDFSLREILIDVKGIKWRIVAETSVRDDKLNFYVCYILECIFDIKSLAGTSEPPFPTMLYLLLPLFVLLSMTMNNQGAVIRS